jgi:hypothetical protein
LGIVVEAVERVSFEVIEAGFGIGWNPDVTVGGRSEAGEEVTVSLWSAIRVGADADASDARAE